jgi:hypothetical protein
MSRPTLLVGFARFCPFDSPKELVNGRKIRVIAVVVAIAGYLYGLVSNAGVARVVAHAVATSGNRSSFV